jgi:hypothetical protein
LRVFRNTVLFQSDYEVLMEMFGTGTTLHKMLHTGDWRSFFRGVVECRKVPPANHRGIMTASTDIDILDEISK